MRGKVTLRNDEARSLLFFVLHFSQYNFAGIKTEPPVILKLAGGSYSKSTWLILNRLSIINYLLLPGGVTTAGTGTTGDGGSIALAAFF